MSAYPLKSTQKIEEEIGRGHPVYSKYNKAALSNSNAPSPFKPDLMRLLVNRGFTDNVITEEDIVNYNFATRGISDSFTALDADDILFTDGVLEAQNAIVTQPDVNYSIRAALNTMERFNVDPMGERIIHTIRTGRSRKASIPILVQVPTQAAKARCANSCALRNSNSAQGYHAIQRIITTREREKKQ